MRGAGRRSRAPRAAALGLALLLASCVQVGGRGGLRSRPRGAGASPPPPHLRSLRAGPGRVSCSTRVCAYLRRRGGVEPAAGESWRRGERGAPRRSPALPPAAVVTRLSPL